MINSSFYELLLPCFFFLLANTLNHARETIYFCFFNYFCGSKWFHIHWWAKSSIYFWPKKRDKNWTRTIIKQFKLLPFSSYFMSSFSLWLRIAWKLSSQSNVKHSHQAFTIKSYQNHFSPSKREKLHQQCSTFNYFCNFKHLLKNYIPQN